MLPHDQVATLLERARALHQPGAYAMFDADGTIWAFDIANCLFAHLVRARALKPEALPPLRAALQASGLSADGDATDCFTRLVAGYDSGAVEEALTYRTMTQALAGFSLAELNVVHARALAETAAQLFPEIRELFARLRALRYRVCVVSASPVWTVQFGLDLCGLNADDVRGAQTEVTGDTISDRLVEPFTYREGKLQVAARDFGRAPTLGFGDSRGDAPFLSACELAVLVNPRPALLGSAREFKDAVVLRCPKTSGGISVAAPERDETVD